MPTVANDKQVCPFFTRTHKMGREKDLENMLSQSGKKEELRQKLLKQLSESGWKDQVFVT